MAKKKYYSGRLLPDFEPLWDMAAYPFVYISFCACSDLGFTVDESAKGEYAHLVFASEPGYIIRGSVPGANIYEAFRTPLNAKNYILALDDDCVESSGWLWPGISTDAWLESTNDYVTAAAAGAGPHWTNLTLFDDAGELFLTSTQPIAYFDLTSWLTGYALGRTGRPLPFEVAQGTLKGCRYGDFVLPYELEWNKTELPYLLILRFKASGNTISWAMNRKIGRFVGVQGYGMRYDDVRAKFCTSRGWLQDSEGTFANPVTWERKKNNTIAIATDSETELIWANYDMYTVDGSLYYTTTPPVKIYE